MLFSVFNFHSKSIQFTAGQLIRNFSGHRARAFLVRYKPILKKIAETSLLYIIFCSMSESFYNGLDASAVEIAVMFVIVLCIHISSLILVWSLSGCRSSKLESTESENTAQNTITGKKTKRRNHCMKFNIYDRIAILFCCSHKTAAFGIPMLTSLYEDNPNLGLYLLPILMYPPIQLISGSLLIQPLSSRMEEWTEQRMEPRKATTYSVVGAEQLQQEFNTDYVVLSDEDQL